MYVFDPYSIALSKVDRGFDTDLDDITFLIKKDMLTWMSLSASHTMPCHTPENLI